jgi:hypothetical protein
LAGKLERVTVAVDRVLEESGWEIPVIVEAIGTPIGKRRGRI